MSIHSTQGDATRRGEMIAPDYLAHWVVKTARSKQMIDWYRTVFGARIVHEDDRVAFLTRDDEHHRLALVKMPRLLRYVFPLARFRRKVYGVLAVAILGLTLWADAGWAPPEVPQFRPNADAKESS